jgi:hypothetical protein
MRPLQPVAFEQFAQDHGQERTKTRVSLLQSALPASKSQAHLNSSVCLAGQERKQKREIDIKNLRNKDVVFVVGEVVVENVDGFCYLGRACL